MVTGQVKREIIVELLESAESHLAALEVAYRKGAYDDISLQDLALAECKVENLRLELASI